MANIIYNLYISVFKSPEDYSGPKYLQVYDFCEGEAVLNIARACSFGAIPIFYGRLITDDSNLVRKFPAKINSIIDKASENGNLNIKNLEAIFE